MGKRGMGGRSARQVGPELAAYVNTLAGVERGRHGTPARAEDDTATRTEKRHVLLHSGRSLMKKGTLDLRPRARLYETVCYSRYAINLVFMSR